MRSPLESWGTSIFRGISPSDAWLRQLERFPPRTFLLGHLTSEDTAEAFRQFGVQGPSSSSCDRPGLRTSLPLRIDASRRTAASAWPFTRFWRWSRSCLGGIPPLAAAHRMLGTSLFVSWPVCWLRPLFGLRWGQFLPRQLWLDACAVITSTSITRAASHMSPILLAAYLFLRSGTCFGIGFEPDHFPKARFGSLAKSNCRCCQTGTSSTGFTGDHGSSEPFISGAIWSPEPARRHPSAHRHLTPAQRAQRCVSTAPLASEASEPLTHPSTLRP